MADKLGLLVYIVKTCCGAYWAHQPVSTGALVDKVTKMCG